MPMMTGLRFAVVVVLASAGVSATAQTCYEIVDRANEVVYQDRTSPIDLSDAGAAARDALRRNGQQLVAMDSERCPAIDRGRISGSGGSATVEEIVAGMRPAVPYGTSATGSRVTRDSGGIKLPEITVPRDTGGGMSVGGPVSGMSIR